MSSEERESAGEAPAAAAVADVIGTQSQPRDEPVETEGESSATSTRIKGRCDLCQKTDGFQGHRLLKCISCGVCAHYVCIGKPTRSGNATSNWKCVACSAVGKRVVVSKPGKKIKTLLQESRPRECVFCSCSTGNHCMHPVYTTHGSKGTHLVLRPSAKKNLPKRLAWTHTLCAMFIGTNPGGIVYGCDKNGDYEGESDGSDDEGGDISDASSDSSQGGSEDESSDKRKELDAKAQLASAAQKNGEDAASTDGKISNEGNSDESGSDDEEELMETHHFVIARKENGRHTPWTRVIEEHRQLKCTYCGKDDKQSLRICVQCRAGSDQELEEFKKRHEDGTYCTQGMHVGCARWGPDGDYGSPEFKRVFFYPGLEIGDSGEYDDPVADCFCNLHAKDVHFNNPKRVAERKNRKKAQKEVSRQDRLMKRQANRKEESNRFGRMTQRGSTTALPAKRRRETEKYDGLEDSELKRLVRKKGGSWKFSDIKDDVLEHVRSAQRQGKNVTEASDKCEKYWRTETEMPKLEFSKVWSDVIMAVEEELSSNDKAPFSVRSKSKKPPAQGHLHTNGKNPWSRLWMDDYCEGGEWSFGEWDEYEEEDI